MGKIIKQNLLKMVQVTVTFFFIMMKSKNEGGRAKKNAFFYVVFNIGQNQGFWAIMASFVRFYQNKKKLEQ